MLCFPTTRLSSLVSTEEEVPSLTVSCYTMTEISMGGHPFLKKKLRWGEWGGRGGREKDWEERREGKLLTGCKFINFLKAYPHYGARDVGTTEL